MLSCIYYDVISTELTDTSLLPFNTLIKLLQYGVHVQYIHVCTFHLGKREKERVRGREERERERERVPSLYYGLVV